MSGAPRSRPAELTMPISAAAPSTVALVPSATARAPNAQSAATTIRSRRRPTRSPQNVATAATSAVPASPRLETSPSVDSSWPSCARWSPSSTPTMPVATARRNAAIRMRRGITRRSRDPLPEESERRPAGDDRDDPPLPLAHAEERDDRDQEREPVDGRDVGDQDGHPERAPLLAHPEQRLDPQPDREVEHDADDGRRDRRERGVEVLLAAHVLDERRPREDPEEAGHEGGPERHQRPEHAHRRGREIGGVLVRAEEAHEL